MRCVLSEGTLDDVGGGLEITPRKHLRRLSQETYVIGIRTTNHKIASFEITNLRHAEQPGKRVWYDVRYCNWFCAAVSSGEGDPLLTSFTDEVWFYGFP